MKIGVDIDGVLFPWADAANSAVMERFGLVDPGAHVTWDHLKESIPADAWAWLWTQEGLDTVFRQGWRIYDGIAPVVRWLMAAGHEVHFVTHRDPCATGTLTAAYLARHFSGVRWAGLHVLQPTVAKRTIGHWDAFIDDKPETVLDFVNNTSAWVFAPVRPWNTELNDVTLFQQAHRMETFIHYDSPLEIAEWAAARV